MDKQPTVENNT